MSKKNLCIILLLLILFPLTVVCCGKTAFKSSGKSVSPDSSSKNTKTIVKASVADFYVSPDGNDSWSGTIAQPNKSKSDGPFKTLTRARDAVRALNKGTRNIVVMVKDGTYTLKRTLVFSKQDSGKNGKKIIYKNYPGEYPIFSSGIPLGKWTKLGNEPRLPKAAIGKVWVTDMPQGLDIFYTMYKDKNRLPRARGNGFKPVLGPKDSNRSRSSMLYPQGTVLKNWSNVSDVEIVIRPWCLWTMNILPLKKIDEEKQIAYTALTGSYPLTRERHGRFGPQSVWVENVLEVLDEPGEWVVNTNKRKIYYWPKGEQPASSIVVPTLHEYFRVEGDEHTNKPVEGIVFEGLTFMHGERDTWSDDDKGLQHDWEMYDKGNAIMRFRWAENCRVTNCLFTNTGGTAIRCDLYSQNIVISNNRISKIGGTGILLAGYGPGTQDVNKNNKIHNNHIHHIGQIYWHNPAILIWQSGDNLVSNNLIHNTPYNSIAVGGVMPRVFEPNWYGRRELNRTINWQQTGLKPGKYKWGDILDFIHTRNNVIEYNELHNSMEILGDGNAIYIRMCPPGNIVRNNYLHHHLGQRSAGVIRADDDQYGCAFENNIIYKFTVGGIVIKRANLVQNNYIIGMTKPDESPEKESGVEDRNGYIKLIGGSMASKNSGATPISESIIRNNIFLHMDKFKPEFYFDTSHWPRNRTFVSDVFFDKNLIYWTDHNLKSKKILKDFQKNDGVDLNGLSADPLFKGFEEKGFKLESDSPAFSLGIEQIEFEKIGLTENFPIRLKNACN